MSVPDRKTAALETFADVRAGIAFPDVEQGRPSGDIPFYKVSDMTTDGNHVRMSRAKHWVSDGTRVRLKGRTFPANTIVFPKVGAALLTNKKRLLSRDSLLDNNIMGVIVRDQSICDPAYLYFWFVNKNLADFAQPGPLPSMNAGTVKAAVVPLPPLAEQRAIARALRAVQAAKDARRRDLDLERERRAAMMADFFTAGVSAEETRPTELGDLPRSWRVVAMREVVPTMQYGVSTPGAIAGHAQLLRMNNIVNGRVQPDGKQFVTLDRKAADSFRVHRGDVLFNRTNSFDLVGKTGLFDTDGECVCASYLIRLVADSSRLMPAYLSLLFNWGGTQGRLKGLASRGVSQSNISAGKLKDFLIPLPDVAEQFEMVRVLNASDAKLDAIQAERHSFDELFRALLEELMSGRLSSVPLIGKGEP